MSYRLSERDNPQFIHSFMATDLATVFILVMLVEAVSSAIKRLTTNDTIPRLLFQRIWLMASMSFFNCKVGKVLIRSLSYILQMMAVAGNSRLPIYSCSKLKVFGGDPGQSCSVPNQIPMEVNCVKAGSPDYRALLTDTKAGSFCFDSNGVQSLFSLSTLI